MDEKKAIAEFWKAANENNEQAARNALAHLSRETVNAQDDDDYTMLITAVQSENPCAVRHCWHPASAIWTCGKICAA